MVHPSPKLGAGGRIFKHRHLRAGSLRILKLILRPHILVAGVGFEPTYSVLMRQASSRTLPSDKTLPVLRAATGGALTQPLRSIMRTLERLSKLGCRAGTRTQNTALSYVCPTITLVRPPFAFAALAYVLR